MTERTNLRRGIAGAAAVVLLCAAGTSLAGSLGDPTRPYTAYRGSGARSAAGVTVSAVISSATRRVAIVNGIVVQAGTRVGDARILEILPDGVRYQRGGKEFISHIAALAANVRARVATPATQTDRNDTTTPETVTAKTKEDSP